MTSCHKIRKEGGPPKQFATKWGWRLQIHLMKTTRISRPLVACLSVLLAGTVAVHAQTTTPKMGGKPAKGMSPMMKRAERVAGKPLNEAQKKTIRSAMAERKKAMKPIQDKYDATVAKALGMTVDQFKARLKATAPKPPV